MSKLIKSAKTPKGFAIIATVALTVAVGAYAIASFAATSYAGQINNVSAGLKRVCFYYGGGSTNGSFQLRADAYYGPLKTSSIAGNFGTGKGSVALRGVSVQKSGSYVKTRIVVNSGRFAYKGVKLVGDGSRCPSPWY